MNFAVLTGGGDSAGINDFLYFLGQRLNREGHRLIGFRHSWQGLIDGDAVELKLNELEERRFTPGTLLGTRRVNPIKEQKIETVLANLEAKKIDVLVALGGDDTLGVAAHLAEKGIAVVGVPQTIDNDLLGTDRSLGFATAVRQAAYSVNEMINSNIAHDRDMIVEVMGRDAGWLALAVALNTPACACMCPEGAMTSAEAVQAMQRRLKRTNRAVLAIVAEGVKLDSYEQAHKERDAFGNIIYEGISHGVAAEYKEATGRTPRVQILAYVMRGGIPVPADVELAAQFANYAVDLAVAGKSGEMTALAGGEMASLPLAEIMGGKKTIERGFLSKQLKLLA